MQSATDMALVGGTFGAFGMGTKAFSKPSAETVPGANVEIFSSRLKSESDAAPVSPVEKFLPTHFDLSTLESQRSMSAQTIGMSHSDLNVTSVAPNEIPAAASIAIDRRIDLSDRTQLADLFGASDNERPIETSAVNSDYSYARPSEAAVRAAKSDIMNMGDLFEIIQADKRGWSKFLDNYLDADERINFLERFINTVHSGSQIEHTRLHGLYQIDTALGGDPETTSRLVNLEEQGFEPYNFAPLVDYLKEGDAARTASVKKMIDDGATVSDINPLRLRAVDELTTELGANSRLLKKILAIPSTNVDLPDLGQFIQEGSNQRKLVSTLLNDGRTTHLSAYYLEPYIGLMDSLSLKSSDVKRLSELENEGLNLRSLDDYLHSATDEKRESIREKFFDGADSSELSPELLHGLDRLQEIYSDDSYEFYRAKNMHGLNLTDLADFADESYGNKQAISKLLNANACRSFFSPEKLRTFAGLDEKLDLTDEQTEKLIGFGSQVMSLLEHLPDSITAENAPRINETLQTAKSPVELKPERLESLQIIENRFGKGAEILERSSVLRSVV